MRSYEMVVILNPDLAPEGIEAVQNRISEIIGNTGGELLGFDMWGKRRMAYEIKDFREGIYFLTNFNGTGDTVKELDRVLKITDTVVRHMIVRKGD